MFVAAFSIKNPSPVGAASTRIWKGMLSKIAKLTPMVHVYPSTASTDTTPNCSYCTDGCSECYSTNAAGVPVCSRCNDPYNESNPDDVDRHVLIYTCPNCGGRYTRCQNVDGVCSVGFYSGRFGGYRYCHQESDMW